jgi:GDP-L-fucose synthase
MNERARLYVAGQHTLIGQALLRRLARHGFYTPIQDHMEPDPTDPDAVARFFESTRPEYVIVAAGKSAGIGGNQRAPADLMLDNLLVAGTLIPCAWRLGVRKLLYLASSCIYPRDAAQPLAATSLWSGPLEPTSSAYAVARLAGLKLCEAYRQQHGASFITAIAADAYGPGDDFTPGDAHVVPSLIRRMHDGRVSGAPIVDVWGSGTPQREFIYADDLADACLVALERYEDPDPINLGSGAYTSIAQLSELIGDVVGYRGRVRFDRSKPDGMPFKGLESSRLRNLGWQAGWSLRRGLEETYAWFLARSDIPQQSAR